MGDHRTAGARSRTGITAQHGKEPGDSTSPARWIAVRDWPVSRRLFALIALALIMGLVFGGLRVAAATDSASEFSRVAQLAQLGERITTLVQALQDERDETAGVIPTAKLAQTATGLARWYHATDAAAAQTRTLAEQVNGSFPANIQSRVSAVLSDLAPGQSAGLAVVRRTALTSQSAVAVIVDYAGPIDDMITLTGQIAEGSNDSGLTTSVQSLTSLAMAKDQAARQRALLFNSFTQGQFADGELQAVETAIADQAGDLASFSKAASPSDQSLERTTVAGPLVNKADLIAQYVTGASGLDLSALNIPPRQAAAQWFAAMSATVQQMQAVEQSIARSVVARSLVLKRNAEGSALLISLVTLAVLLVVLAITVVMARSMVRALRTLREGALAIATVHLPERVRQLSEAAEPMPELVVTPIDIQSADEIGQVARAFDEVHAEAIRLAGNEAMLRTSFNAMFVNLSRRSQLLIERLARTIDSLEQREDDPERLADLFTMDHMVTRMRRNSENLLLLAGHEGTRKWSEPVSLANVTRAATSEIEQYSRVTQRVQSDIAVSGRAASDVVHLLAEIIENATIFSSHETQVHVSAERVATGGVLVHVSDSGVGIPEARLAELNARLDDPPDMDISVSRHMGLYAVARLARRLGVRVRLLAGTPRGLDALVWLPDSILEREVAPAPWQVGERQASVLTPSRNGSFGSSGHASSGTPGFTPTVPSFSEAPSYTGSRSSVDTPAFGIPSFAPPAPAGMPAVAGVPPMVVASRLSGRKPAPPPGSPASPWFRSKRPSSPSAPPATGPVASGWAEASQAPTVNEPPPPSDFTQAGLPKRVPKPSQAVAAQVLAAPEPEPEPVAVAVAAEPSRPEPVSSTSGQQRTPELARSRLSGFQRGIRRARSGPSTRERIVD